MNETPEPPRPAGTPPPPGHEPPAAEAETSAAAEYPVQAFIDHQAEYSRFLPLVKWLLLIPHYIALMLLGIAAFFAIAIAWFAVVFTRAYPRGLFDFVVGVYRWGWRVNAYMLLMTDSYPPFSLKDDPAYPARFDIAYPEEGVDRWRPFFAWLVAIPYLVVAGILTYLGMLMSFFAFFTILFAKRFPPGMFNIALVALRWQARGNAYAYWLITRYPPWVWA